MERFVIFDEGLDAVRPPQQRSAMSSASQLAGSLSVQRRRRLAIAAIAAVAGLIAIVAGYIGVSGTRVISDQLSYIASGSMVGLFLVALAGGLVIADYMVEQSRILNEVHAYLEALVYGANARPSASVSGNTVEAAMVGDGDEFAVPPARGGGLVVLAGSRRVHRFDCQLVVGKRDVQRLDHAAEDMRPCRICKPDLASATVAPS